MSAEIKFEIDREIELLNEALKDRDEFYTEVKDHYDKVKKGGAGTLMFVEKQTNNLISLQSNKVSIIQQLINAKKTKAEIELKEANLNKGQQGTDENVRQIAEAMYTVILENKKDANITEMISGTKKKEELEQNVEDIDAQLEQRLAVEEAKEQEEKEEEVVASKPQEEYQLVVDINGNIYCLDNDYNIIEDAIIPDDLEITIREEEGEYHATDQHGNDYDVVEFTDDEE